MRSQWRPGPAQAINQGSHEVVNGCCHTGLSRVCAVWHRRPQQGKQLNSKQPRTHKGSACMADGECGWFSQSEGRREDWGQLGVVQ